MINHPNISDGDQYKLNVEMNAQNYENNPFLNQIVTRDKKFNHDNVIRHSENQTPFVTCTSM